MFELLIILIAQVFITLADTFVRTQLRTHGKLMFRGAHARDWLLRYLPARFGGLMIRLFALIHVQVGVAATMFAATMSIGMFSAAPADAATLPADAKSKLCQLAARLIQSIPNVPQTARLLEIAKAQYAAASHRMTM